MKINSVAHSPTPHQTPFFLSGFPLHRGNCCLLGIGFGCFWKLLIKSFDNMPYCFCGKQLSFAFIFLSSVLGKNTTARQTQHTHSTPSAYADASNTDHSWTFVSSFISYRVQLLSHGSGERFPFPSSLLLSSSTTRFAYTFGIFCCCVQCLPRLCKQRRTHSCQSQPLQTL